jgi:hypothetical protein
LYYPRQHRLRTPLNMESYAPVEVQL